jgi:glycosyltransferase involved in cell wall biosynthesis
MNEKISVVIPYYKGEEYILETLKSVYDQTYQDFEIIIVNDGSDHAVLNSIEGNEAFKNLRIIHQENQGQSSARNNGAKHASGKYILFLDCDDIIEKLFLKKRYIFFKTNPKSESAIPKENSLKKQIRNGFFSHSIRLIF